MSDSVRDYSMTDAELMMYASNLVQFITRDTVQFADFGVNSAAITAFQTLGNQFETFPPDLYYQADISVATEAKDNARSTLILETRKITNRALAKWGENSPEYKKFGVKGITLMTDKALLATARLVVHTAGEYQTALASDGLTTDLINDYEAVAQQFEVALNTMNTAIALRDKKTKERIILGNQLYAYVTKYCTFGKSIWDKVDEAYFNDYLIYTGSAPVTMDKPTGLAFDSLTQTFRWNEVENASSYVLQASNDGENFSNVYAGPNLSVVYEPTFLGNNVFRVKARNSSGLSEASEILEVEYYSVLPVPQNLNAVLENPNTVNFTFSPVPTADRYILFRNVVAIGAPAGVFNQMGETAFNYYIGPIEQGKRTYYKVKAAVDLRESDFSHFVYLDVPITPV